MCGRFTYKLPWPELMRLYRLTLDAPGRNPQPRYNICPTDTIDAVTERDGKRELVPMRWGERFVVIGFVPEGSSGLLKLRLARREGRELVYVGRVGTGWDRKTAGEIRRALEPLARSTTPLAKPLKKQDTTWVEPRFDAEINYAEITDDGMVRHPSFKRLVP